jgi:hypothetical protein
VCLSAIKAALPRSRIPSVLRTLPDETECVRTDAPLFVLPEILPTRWRWSRWRTVCWIEPTRSRKSTRDKPVGASIADKHKRNVGAAFNVASRLGYAKVNPCIGIKQNRVSNRTAGYSTPAEFGALLIACRVFSEQSRRLVVADVSTAQLHRRAPF